VVIVEPMNVWPLSKKSIFRFDTYKGGVQGYGAHKVKKAKKTLLRRRIFFLKNFCHKVIAKQKKRRRS
jgi:hypothetical protein